MKPRDLLAEFKEKTKPRKMCEALMNKVNENTFEQKEEAPRLIYNSASLKVIDYPSWAGKELLAQDIKLINEKVDYGTKC
jgi:hypothetical protein